MTSNRNNVRLPISTISDGPHMTSSVYAEALTVTVLDASSQLNNNSFVVASTEVSSYKHYSGHIAKVGDTVSMICDGNSSASSDISDSQLTFTGFAVNATPSEVKGQIKL